MSLDKDKIRFWGKLMTAANRFGGSAEGDETQPFVDRLYAEYCDAHLTLNECEQWLVDRLANQFISIGQPPCWVEDEPAWPFVDGIPMVFIAQHAFGDSDLDNERLSPGETIYLFAGRRRCGDKTKMEYKIVSQFVDT